MSSQHSTKSNECHGEDDVLAMYNYAKYVVASFWNDYTFPVSCSDFICLPNCKTPHHQVPCHNNPSSVQRSCHLCWKVVHITCNQNGTLTKRQFNVIRTRHVTASKYSLKSPPCSGSSLLPMSHVCLENTPEEE